MQEPSALGRIVQLVRDLRTRCPWDAAQTPETLRPYLVEEALELDHAIAKADPETIETELGDLFLHVAFQIVLAEEMGRFGAEDLTRSVEEKMWRRHPHLFPEEGKRQERQRRQERQEKPTWEYAKLAEHGEHRPSVLDGLPPTLPALIMAFRLQERAAGVGFDWRNARGPLVKLREELGELEQELQQGDATQQLEEEIGDLIFAAVNLARKLGCDPRAALEKANAKFSERFRRLEELASERGIEVGRAELEVLEELWEEAKGSN
ncbi:MAG: nucleoside triphosphate pyrophosphohydrolase [Gemmatimonadales bacterium]|nr:nucleoside triphosphate pyrophosphohydrolase [Gemmatimonadales bacterium]NIN50027.1 nucleoside triphosphate pyrophosphohydrolase [Gemmatimonadales bacterium]NIP07491.1 nucleoside triphosphate pyrophosphohydrolase [Gemmatimonadales bacterium]NIR03130.1 nucleoside triphosphate pyrophosphohydrolase [Gemmatimonadales bacterium]NIS66842.1 nucleoside triphosphate pyrophosphohydrolase [Gemmatimonadales bacterium]